MICQTPPASDHTNRFSLSLYSNTHIKDTSPKRHTIASGPQELEDFFLKQQSISNSRIESEVKEEIKLPIPTIQPTNNENHQRVLKSHWEMIESHFINHLSALQSEIDVCNKQKLQLTKARDELVQGIIQLQQMTIDLTTKNEQLTRMIAEKENKVSAFMYQEHQRPFEETIQQQLSEPIIGVTLVDEPLIEPHTNDQISTSQDQVKEITPKKELGIFRQISRRISSRRKNKEITDTTQSSPLAIEIIDEVVPSTTKKDALLHPAVVISTPDESQQQQLNRPRLLLKSNSLLRKKKKNPMFGTDIVQQARSENAVVPHVVLKCVREVEFRGLKTEGIYRKSGTHSQVTELKEAFDNNKDPNLSKYDDINVISSLLKLYLREAETCLLSQAFILDASLSSKERLNQTYALLHNLPLEAYCTIKFIMQHLKRVHQYHSVNHMPAKNIAIVFGPTLMRFNNDGNEELQMNNMIKTVEFIIEQSHILFANF